MSYSDPNRIKYPFFFDFGSGTNETFSIFGPKNRAGRLHDFGVEGVVEVFAGSSNTPGMSVGTPSDPDAYGEEFDFGAVADNHAKSVRSTYDPAKNKTQFDAIILPNIYIPANQEVVLTFIASTGTPTGQATGYAIIDWDL